MADFTSSNAGLGGLYQAGFNVDSDQIEWTSYDDRNIPANQVEYRRYQILIISIYQMNIR